MKMLLVPHQAPLIVFFSSLFSPSGRKTWNNGWCLSFYKHCLIDNHFEFFDDNVQGKLFHNEL
jgi:hypothetical protein